MRALGMTCGVGSMLIGAKQAGFDITGNIEWRPYYHTGTFEYNFKAPMVRRLEDATYSMKKDVDLIMGHTECGNFSNLRCKKDAKLGDCADIPLFIEAINEIRPKYFVHDNLPKSLIAFPMKLWAEALPDYDLFPEWISNYHYGNAQINRKRFFMIGALKTENFIFRPGEYEHETLLRDVLVGLPPRRNHPKINHIHWKNEDIMRGWGPHNFDLTRGKEHVTLEDFKKVIKDYPDKKNFAYYNRFGEQKLRPGYSKIVLDNYAPVMTGGGSAPDNHYRSDTLTPLTMRERARIQGCPDDFIFQPLNYMNDKKTYMDVYKQIGKFMPVEFCNYVSELILANVSMQACIRITGKRFIKNNPFVNEAKKWYCENVSYGEYQEEVCQACGVTVCGARQLELFKET